MINIRYLIRIVLNSKILKRVLIFETEMIYSFCRSGITSLISLKLFKRIYNNNLHISRYINTLLIWGLVNF